MAKQEDPNPSEVADVERFGDIATSLSLLSGEVIHEVTHTLNFLQYLLQEVLGSDAAETVRFTTNEFDRVHRLIGSLRRLKLPVPEPQEVSLSAVVRQTIEQVQDAVPQRELLVETRIPSDTLIRTDATCLASALRNLLLDILERVPAGTPFVITSIVSELQPLQLEIAYGGEALPVHAATPPSGWDVWPPMTPAFRRTIAYRLLRHLGWSMSDEQNAQGHVVRLSAPLPMRISL